MTESEICRSFLAARHRRRQIGVLSELTLLKQREIKAILEKNGINWQAPAPRIPKYTYNEARDFSPGKPVALQKEVRCYVNKRNRICRY